MYLYYLNNLNVITFIFLVIKIIITKTLNESLPINYQDPKVAKILYNIIIQQVII